MRLSIYTNTIEVKAKTIRFRHQMFDCESGEVVSTCVLVAAHLDTKVRKAVPLPIEVGEKAARHHV